jgi:hypothetical protein
MARKYTRSLAAVLPLFLPLLFAPANARANATFEFALSGELDAKLYGPGGDYFYPWTGALTIVLDSAADGTYGNDDMVSFDLVSTCSSFHQPRFTFLPFVANFTVSGGKLTSIDAVYYDADIPDITTTFHGLTVSYQQPIQHASPETVGTAVLTPLSVPEPAAVAMLVLGLAVAIGARQRR